MRIAILTPFAGDLFGQERVLRDSARLLRKDGHEVFVITEDVAGTPDYCDDLIQIKGASTLNQLSPPWKVRELNGKVLSYLHAKQPDVVHFIDQFDHRLFGQIRTRYPVLVSAHSVAPTCPASARLILGNQVCPEIGGWKCVSHMRKYHCLDLFRGFLRRFLVIDRFMRQRKQYIQADHIVAVSHYIRNLLIENGWSAERISVVYNPVEIKRPDPLPDAPKHLLSCVSRLHALKGIDVVLRALTKIKEKDWELWICGEGSERARLETMARDLGIGARVKFLGKTPYEKTQRVIASSRCLIQANVAPESFGLAAAEAAALGVPVISSNLPALNEILIEGKSGVFFPPNDEKALANAIDEMFSNEALVARIRREGREVCENYAPYRHLEGMIRAYESCISHFHGDMKKKAAA